jgi:hypothetical protein
VELWRHPKTWEETDAGEFQMPFSTCGLLQLVPDLKQSKIKEKCGAGLCGDQGRRNLETAGRFVKQGNS